MSDLQVWNRQLPDLHFLSCPVLSCCAACAGTFAVVSIMIGGVTERLAPAVANVTNTTEGADAADAARVKIACSLTLLTGIFQVPVKPSGGRQRGLHALPTHTHSDNYSVGNRMIKFLSSGFSSYVP